MTASAGENFRVRTVADYIVACPDEEELTALCELAALLCETPAAAVSLVDDRFQYAVAAYGAETVTCDRAESLSATAITGNEDVYVEDASQDPRFANNPRVDGRLGTIRMYATAVLRTPTGAVVGTLSVFDDRVDRPAERRLGVPERRKRVLATLGRQVVDLFELRIRTNVLARTNAELRRSQEHLAAFAGQISHDLKTPLTATLGFAELLSEHSTVTANPVVAGYVERCLSSSRRMLLMIDELLGYARLGGTLQRRMVDLNEVVPLVLEDLGELAHRGTVRWSGDAINADPAQLRALLQNLICNSLTYARDGVAPEVLVTSLNTPIGTELVVADNGSGIPADQRAEVLLPLVRLRTDVPGTGIGLATCKRIATAHGGALQVGESPGGGTTITIVFPR